MGMVPPPMPRIPEGATWEDRCRMYEIYALSLVDGAWPWKRKALREHIQATVAKARKDGPPVGSGVKP